MSSLAKRRPASEGLPFTDVDALPGLPPGTWFGKLPRDAWHRTAGRIWRERATGWPLWLRHRATGIELVRVPQSPGSATHEGSMNLRFAWIGEGFLEEPGETTGGYIGRFPVTEAQLAAMSARDPYPASQPDPETPATDIDFEEAQRIAQEHRFTLPRLSEWLQAAAGATWYEPASPGLGAASVANRLARVRSIHPERTAYEDGPSPDRVRTAASSGLAEVPRPRIGGRPEGAGATGAEDLLGTVWEWILAPAGFDVDTEFVVGGSDLDFLVEIEASPVRRLPVGTRADRIGFRLWRPTPRAPSVVGLVAVATEGAGRRKGHSGRPLDEELFPCLGSESQVAALGSDRLVASDHAGTLHIYDLRRRRVVASRLSRGSGSRTPALFGGRGEALLVDPRGRWVLAQADSASFEILSGRDLRLLRRWECEADLTLLDVSSDGDRLLVGSLAGAWILELRDENPGTVPVRFRLCYPGRNVADAAFGPDPTRIRVCDPRGGPDYELPAWDPVAPRRIPRPRLFEALSDRPSSVTPSRNRSCLLVTVQGNRPPGPDFRPEQIRYAVSRDDTACWRLPENHSRSLGVVRDVTGRELLVLEVGIDGRYDPTIAAYLPGSREPLWLRSLPDKASLLGVDPKRARIFVAEGDRRLVVLDAGTGNEQGLSIPFRAPAASPVRSLPGDDAWVVLPYQGEHRVEVRGPGGSPRRSLTRDGYRSQIEAMVVRPDARVVVHWHRKSATPLRTQWLPVGRGPSGGYRGVFNPVMLGFLVAPEVRNGTAGTEREFLAEFTLSHRPGPTGQDQVPRVLAGHWCQSTGHFVWIDDSGNLGRFDGLEYRQDSRIPGGHTPDSALEDAAFGAIGRYLATVDAGGKARVWELASTGPRCVAETDDPGGLRVSVAALSPRVALARLDGSLELLDGTSGWTRHRIAPRRGGFQLLALDPSGCRLAAQTASGVSVWIEGQSGWRERRLRTSGHGIQHLDWSASGTCLYGVDRVGDAFRWFLPEGDLGDR